MAIVRPFAGLRPKKEYAARLASPPYDVLSSEEAREMAQDNPFSFLHIIKPEIDLDPQVDPYDQKVYEKGAENLKKFMRDGILVQDKKPAFYVYKQVMGNHQQIGLVGCASVDEYEQDIIKKHELTRPDKEDDRVNLINHLNAQTGPVFLTYRANEQIDRIINKIVLNEPEYDFRHENNAPDVVRHIFWVVSDTYLIQQLKSEFQRVDHLYVADGHHRSAAAMRIKQMRQNDNPHHSGNEEYNFFLGVIFPDNQMKILDYNRVVKDLNGLKETEFLDKISKKFTVSKMGRDDRHGPSEKHTFGMYLNGYWYKLTAGENTFDENNSVDRLDVSILQNNLLFPVSGIEDPRKDKRIDFVGGIRGLGELEKRVNSGQWAAAFALYPTSMLELMAIAEAGKIMPPKSTWFEPKLRSGLVTHLLGS